MTGKTGSARWRFSSAMACALAIAGGALFAPSSLTPGYAQSDDVDLQRLLDRGGKIVVPRGVYRLGSPLKASAKSGGTIVFDPHAQIVRAFSGNAMLLVVGDHWKIFGGDWSGDLPRRSGEDSNAAIWLQGDDNLVCNATIHDTVRGIGNVGSGNAIVHNFLHDISGIAIMQSGALGAQVLFNLSRDVGAEAITLDNGARGALVMGNRAVGVCRIGCFGGIGAGNRSDGNRVEANLIDGVAHSSRGGGGRDGSGACIALNGDRNVVADNVCLNINGIGVLINPNDEYATPSGNEIEGNWNGSISGSSVENERGPAGAREGAVATEIPELARKALARTRAPLDAKAVTEGCATEP